MIGVIGFKIIRNEYLKAKRAEFLGKLDKVNKIKDKEQYYKELNLLLDYSFIVRVVSHNLI